MLNGLATLEEVQHLGQYFAQALPEQAKELSQVHAHPDGREVYTRAVWRCFADLRALLGEGWSLYPSTIAKGAGKASGEYLVDFMLMDETFGPRIACESELGGIESIEWALDKLRGVKSDVKILLFEDDFAKEGGLPPRIAELTKQYLAGFGHYLPSEHFLFVQLSRNQCKCFLWSPPSRGPLGREEIVFSEL